MRIIGIKINGNGFMVGSHWFPTLEEAVQFVLKNAAKNLAMAHLPGSVLDSDFGGTAVDRVAAEFLGKMGLDKKGRPIHEENGKHL